MNSLITSCKQDLQLYLSELIHSCDMNARYDAARKENIKMLNEALNIHESILTTVEQIQSTIVEKRTEEKELNKELAAIPGIRVKRREVIMTEMKEAERETKELQQKLDEYLKHQEIGSVGEINESIEKLRRAKIICEKAEYEWTYPNLLAEIKDKFDMLADPDAMEMIPALAGAFDEAMSYVKWMDLGDELTAAIQLEISQARQYLGIDKRERDITGRRSMSTGGEAIILEK